MRDPVQRMMAIALLCVFTFCSAVPSAWAKANMPGDAGRASEETVLETASATDTLDGIDISHWNSGIDIAGVTADFVFVKATQGTHITDSCFRRFASRVRGSGKLLGIYHYADGGSSGKREARYFLQQVGRYVGKAVLVLDWEEPRAVKQGPEYAKEWLDYVYRKTHVRPLVYMSQNPTKKRDWSEVARSGYKLWLARWLPRNRNKDTYLSPSKYQIPVGYWDAPIVYQYSSTGHVSGCSQRLDIDKFYGSRADWKALARPSYSRKVKGITYIADGRHAVAADASEVPANATIAKKVTIKGKAYRVTEVGPCAFYRAANLESVRIGSQATLISANAFAGARRLTAVDGGEAVTDIGRYAYQDCVRLRSYEIGDEVRIMREGVFLGTKRLKEVSGGKRLRSIGTAAFEGCAALEQFEISSKRLSKIGAGAFARARKLRVLDISSTLKLSQTGVSDSLLKSRVSKVMVPADKVSEYRRCFAKGNCGRKVKVVAPDADDEA